MRNRITLAAFLLAILTAAGPQAYPAVPRVSTSRLAALKDPLCVTHVGQLYDGGTLIVGLADEDNQADGVLFNYKRRSAAQGRLYADGRLVTLGGAEQDKVLAAIRRYLDLEFSNPQQTAIARGTLKSASLSDGERGFYAYRLLRAAGLLKKLSEAAKLKHAAGHAALLDIQAAHGL